MFDQMNIFKTALLGQRKNRNTGERQYQLLNVTGNHDLHLDGFFENL